MIANDLDPADPTGTRRGHLVLVTDASAEGESIGSALRARGFLVVDVPLGLLEARVAGERPDALVIDIDEPGASEALDRVRERSAGAAAEVVCVGDPIRAAELGVAAAFERPVDIASLVAHLARVVAPGERSRWRAPTQPPSARPIRERHDRRSVPPSRGEALGSLAPPAIEDWQSFSPGTPGALPSFAAAAVGPDDADPGSDPLDLASLLEGRADGSIGSDLSPEDLSPDLAALLSAAERRVSGGGSAASFPAPADDLDLVLPPELLAMLDEPLDADGEGGTGSAAGTGDAVASVTRGGTGALSIAAMAFDGSTGEHTARDPDPRRAQRSPTPLPPDRTGAGSSAPALTDTDGAVTVGGEELAASSATGRGTAPWSITHTATTFNPEIDDPRPSSFPASSAPLDRSRSTRPPPPSGGADHDEPDAPTLAQRPSTHALPPPPFPHLELGPSPAPPLGARHAARLAPGFQHAPPLAPGFQHAPPLDRHSEGMTPFPPERATSSPAPPPSAADHALPAVLGEGDALRTLGRAIAARASGSLALAADAGPRRIVLRDGDVVTAGSGVTDETLAAFLAGRGDIDREVAVRLASKLPPFGRHAGAALVAHGHLGQDDLWPVLRAHAEWLIGRAVIEPRGTCELEDEPPGRLKAEPSVFGGATGAEVLVETVRRVLTPLEALHRLGGPDARLEEGARVGLLGECALRPDDAEAVRAAAGRTVAEALQGHDPVLANVLYALTALGVLDAHAEAPRAPTRAKAPDDPLDAEALRQRVRARMALVDDGDYFALLGVPRSATSYEVRRAYLELRRSLEPGRVLTAATADLGDDLRLILEVLDEAYEILREPHRRDRYRKAIEVGPP